jgi:hypothetical protein
METLETLQVSKTDYSSDQKEKPEVTTPVICLIPVLSVEDFLDPDLTVKALPRSLQLCSESSTHQQGEAGVTPLRDGNIQPAEIEKPVSFLSFVINDLRSLSCDVYGISFNLQFLSPNLAPGTRIHLNCVSSLKAFDLLSATNGGSYAFQTVAL